jgi:alanine dehydrogenase
MNIGIPAEVKVLEGRVALIPDAVSELVKYGHQVFIEKNAGLLSGYSNEAYQVAGAKVLDDAEKVFESAQMIVKVKEPQPSEWPLLHSDHLLFSYLHLAAEPALTKALLEIGLTAVAFETITDHKRLPLLAPMSDIAGRVAVQAGTHLLHQPQKGRGILLGGLAGTERGNVVVLGAGVSGSNAVRLAAGVGANVIVFDRNREKLDAMRQIGANVTALYASSSAIFEAVKQADLLIGAVLIPGAKAPHLVSTDMVKQMKQGSVIIDISVDQGGCIETTHPTTYEDPTYIKYGVVHFGVTNMPGAVPRTASQALSAALVPYSLRLCQPGWEEDRELNAGINLKEGKIVLPILLDN